MKTVFRHLHSTAYVYGSKADANATISKDPMMGCVDVSSGIGSVKVTVTAEDETVNTYIVNFSVAGLNDITALTLNTPDNPYTGSWQSITSKLYSCNNT